VPIIQGEPVPESQNQMRANVIILYGFPECYKNREKWKPPAYNIGKN
jgi:hypothetical protein